MQRPELLHMLEALKKCQPNNWLNTTLTIQAPSDEGFGMHGSGLFIINPPWTLPITLATSLPIMRDLLALDDFASFTLTHKIS